MTWLLVAWQQAPTRRDDAGACDLQVIDPHLAWLCTDGSYRRGTIGVCQGGKWSVRCSASPTAMPYADWQDEYADSASSEFEEPRERGRSRSSSPAGGRGASAPAARFPRPRRLRIRAGPLVRPHVAVRRPRRGRRRAGHVPARPGRRREHHRHPRPRCRCPRLLQRLPPPWLDAARRAGGWRRQRQDRAHPVSRTTPGSTISTARSAGRRTPRRSHDFATADQGLVPVRWKPGRVSSSSTWIPTRRTPARLPGRSARRRWAATRSDLLRRARRIEYDVGANWKVIGENYSECLPLPGRPSAAQPAQPVRPRLEPRVDRSLGRRLDGAHRCCRHDVDRRRQPRPPAARRASATRTPDASTTSSCGPTCSSAFIPTTS